MKLNKFCVLTSALLLASCAAKPPKLTTDAPVIYINQNMGFNVPGYKYKQAEIPCKIEANLVQNLINEAAYKNIRLEAVSTPDKINNHSGIPVLAIDIKELVLGGKGKQFGTDSYSDLPKIEITTALFSSDSRKSMQTEDHSCAIYQLNQFTPSSNVLDLGTSATVCSAIEECLEDLSEDVIEWMAPIIPN